MCVLESMRAWYFLFPIHTGQCTYFFFLKRSTHWKILFRFRSIMYNSKKIRINGTQARQISLLLHVHISKYFPYSGLCCVYNCLYCECSEVDSLIATVGRRPQVNLRSRARHWSGCTPRPIGFEHRALDLRLTWGFLPHCLFKKPGTGCTGRDVFS